MAIIQFMTKKNETLRIRNKNHTIYIMSKRWREKKQEM